MRSKGFTLIEVLIAISIFAFIAMAVYQNTSQSFALRDNLEKDGEFYNTLRIGLDLLGRDITHIFSPQRSVMPGNLGKAGNPDANQNAVAGGNSAYAISSFGPPTYFWGEPINPSGLRPSRFQGESNKLSFIVNSHIRLFRDSKESELAKVSFTLEDDPTPIKDKAGATITAKALVKQEDPTVFEEDEISDKQQKYIILSGLKSLDFEYLDGEKDQWHRRWDTSGMDHKNTFPAVIKVTLEVFTPGGTSTFKLVQNYRSELPQ